MSINLYSIKSILNIKDDNITFDEGFYLHGGSVLVGLGSEG